MEGFLLNKGTLIQVAHSKDASVLYIADILKRDINKVFDKSWIEEQTIIDVIIEEGNHMVPETFRIEVLAYDNLRIISPDQLGAIYGLLHISKVYLKIDPFWFFTDQNIESLEKVFIKEKEYGSTPFYIKYRGWFINDEVLLLGWDDKQSDLKVWERVFETLLRLGGNMVIPGTGGSSHQLRQIATRMGLWITHHHAEPLGARMFLNVYPDKVPSYAVNEKYFEQLWKEAVDEQKGSNVIWNIGFRGQGDRAFWEDDPRYDTMQKRGALITQIMKRQYEIINEKIENPIVCTNLYGEVLELYKQGFLKFPEGTIKIWADSGYGKMVSRRQNNHNPRVCSVPKVKDIGPHGIYYHITFYDLQASNHLTMLPNTPEFVRKELTDAFKAGANEYLIVNCGNIRPHIYFLDLVRRLWEKGEVNRSGHKKEFINRYFKTNQDAIQKCVDTYFENIIQYGIHEDEKAGEQFYHYLSRTIVSFWMKGEKEDFEETLFWATGHRAFPLQVEWFKEKCEVGLDKWTRLKSECLQVANTLKENEKQFFMDWLYTQVVLHESGCKGGIALGKSYKCFKNQEDPQAFVYAVLAKKSFEEGLEAMQLASHDKWQSYYENDCLTNVKLTVYCLENLVRYLRMIGDSPNFYKWEKEYLYPETEKGVVLITNVKNHLEDEKLAKCLGEKWKIDIRE